MNIPLLADKSGRISREYGVYIEEEGITFRGLFIIDTKGNLRQITINDLPVSISNGSAFRLLQHFELYSNRILASSPGWQIGG